MIKPLFCRARSDLLALFVASALLLEAFSSIDVTVREKEEVRLAGVDFQEVTSYPTNDCVGGSHESSCVFQ